MSNQSDVLQNISNEDLRKEMTRRRMFSEPHLQAVQLIADGHTTSAVADKMHISPRTVESYIDKLCKELGAINSVHLIAILLRENKIK